MDTRRHHWQLGLAMLLALPIVIALLWPTRHGHNPMHGNRGKCYSNLRQLGQALQMYANEYGGAMPPDWAALVLTQDLPNELIVCPASGDERPMRHRRPSFGTNSLRAVTVLTRTSAQGCCVNGLRTT